MTRTLYVVMAVLLVVTPCCGNRARRRGSQCGVSRGIVTKARVCIEHIDDMKDSFVRDILSYTWDRADSKYPLGDMQAPYLPQPPTATYRPSTFHYELVRHYELLQHSLLAFEYLTLDQALYPFYHNHLDNVNTVDRRLNVFTSHMKRILARENLEGNLERTVELGLVVYANEGMSIRKRRAFVILRNTRATLLHVVEVFQTYCG